jgi:hypothetical protein
MQSRRRLVMSDNRFSSMIRNASHFPQFNREIKLLQFDEAAVETELVKTAANVSSSMLQRSSALRVKRRSWEELREAD